MYSQLKYAFALLALCFSFSKTYAQNDTTHYDLGRIKVDKNFTQSITIKAADLDKQPFTNLSEAINVWLNGTYSNNNNQVYVVDGNLVNDVNVYNINDIEEITLVQTALAQATGASTAQQMILITTKRNHPGKAGIIATGQTNLVTLKNKTGNANASSTTNLYHQYYLSAYKNTDVINAGVSATYLRDLSPVISAGGSTVKEVPNLSRFRFNGYADVKLNQGNTLSATVNYTPQTDRADYQAYNATISNVSSQVYELIHQHIFNANLQLNSVLAKGLSNKLSATYNRYYNSGYYGYTSVIVGPYNSTSIYRDSTNVSRKTFLINDNLSYKKVLGNLSFEPSVNFSYRNLRDSTGYFYSIYSTYDPQSNTPNSSATSNYKVTAKRNDFFLTPSLSLTYKNSINVQGGMLVILNSKKSLDFNADSRKRLFPFATASINVSKLTGIKAIDVQLYGSYSKQNIVSQAATAALTDLSEVYITGINYAPVLDGSYYNGNNIYKALNTYNAGAVVGISSVVSVSYGYYRTHNLIPVSYAIPDGGNGSGTLTLLTDNQLTSNRVGVIFNVINKGNTRFTTSLNATNLKQRTYITAGPMIAGNKLWTGGWVNRLEAGDIFAGIDVLYQKGPPGAYYAVYNYQPYSTQNNYSFSLQNIYVGYRVKTTALKNLEVFANGRNVLQNDKSLITNNRVYYGAGFKLAL
jgi:hypothetical protein